MDGGLSHRQSSHKEDQSAAEPETLGAARGSSAAAALKTARRSSEQPAARRRVEAPPGQRTLGAARGGAAARSHRVRRAVNVWQRLLGACGAAVLVRQHVGRGGVAQRRTASRPAKWLARTRAVRGAAGGGQLHRRRARAPAQHQRAARQLSAAAGSGRRWLCSRRRGPGTTRQRGQGSAARRSPSGGCFE